MSNIDLVLTLVFSIVMLLFMIYPAMKSTEWLESVIDIDEKWHNYIMLSLIVIYSLAIGIFLKFA